MTSALEILTAERDAIAATLVGNQQYLATLLTETAKVKKAMAENEQRHAELQDAIVKLN